MTCTCGVPECSNWCSINWSQADGVVTWTIPADELAHSRYQKHTSSFALNPDGSLTLQFDQLQYTSAVHALQEDIAQHLQQQPCALLAEDFDTTSASEWTALLFKWNQKVEKLLTEHTAIRRFHNQSLQLGLGSFQNQTVQLSFPVYALLYILSPSFPLSLLRETLENYDLTALATALAHSPDAVNYLNITSMDNRDQHPSSQELDALWNHWKLKPIVAFIR